MIYSLIENVESNIINYTSNIFLYIYIYISYITQFRVC